MIFTDVPNRMFFSCRLNGNEEKTICFKSNNETVFGVYADHHPYPHFKHVDVDQVTAVFEVFEQHLT
ncbi:MAG: hypothetical protein WC631_00350 [Candidatus Paceibacterota bacterium]|jgi:hypothetical protein